MRLTLNRVGMVALALAACIAAPQVASADLIYDFTPYTLDNGTSIDGGTITVTDTAPDDGILAFEEILTYALENTNHIPTSFTLTPSGSSPLANELVIVGTLLISPTEISVGLPVDGGYNKHNSSLSFSNYHQVGGSARNDVSWYIREGALFNQISIRKGSTVTTTQLPITDSILVATATGAGGGAVPEPMTMLAVGMSIAGLGGYVKRRRKLA